jgi:hypothetical protein
MSDRILHVSDAPRIAVVTFATTSNERPFNDYSRQIENLRQSVTSFKLELFVYTFHDLKKLISQTSFEKYPKFRRGVGGWFWKPIIILDFLSKQDFDYVLYLDVDCLLLKNPVEVIRNIPTSFDLAGFKMPAPIGDWTAPRILNVLKARENSAESMWTAGILIIKNSEAAKSSLRLWLNVMRQPKNLFDLPFETGGERHRHDQSLFSILIAQKKISVFDLGEGFYSEGIEATSNHIETAWISTGMHSKSLDLEPNSKWHKIMKRIANQLHYRSIRFSRYSFWIFYSVGLAKFHKKSINAT